ncbi:hypothetical protein HY641_02445 [Candidatus Woesearchaeota archaeon]|nr:hypothetical protein [Candidatus Woesearchaeota archaeon]
MKSHMLIVVVIALFLVACQASPPPETSLVTPPDQTAAPTSTVTAPSTSISPKLAKLIGKADEKVTSYEFYYAPPPDNLARDRYFVKGNKIHMIGYRVNTVKRDQYYDNLYFDLDKSEVRAFCQSVDFRCKEIGKEFNVDMEDVIIKLPYQWVKEITGGDISGSETLFDRLTSKVTYVKDGVTYTQWIDEHSGLPLRILIEKPGKKAEKYEFKDLAINGVTDDMLRTPQ